jgi:hypothetical protein
MYCHSIVYGLSVWGLHLCSSCCVKFRLKSVLLLWLPPKVSLKPFLYLSPRRDEQTASHICRFQTSNSALHSLSECYIVPIKDYSLYVELGWRYLCESFLPIPYTEYCWQNKCNDTKQYFFVVFSELGEFGIVPFCTERFKNSSLLVGVTTLCY